MPLSGSVLRAALVAAGGPGAIGGQVRSLDELAAGANAALLQAPSGLTSAGAASWLATQAMEGAWLRATREYGQGQPYAPWIGRTFEQLTHEEAYRRFGAWCHAHGLLADPLLFVRNPAALEDYRWAWLGGVFYFEWRGLWPIANRGDHLQVSRIVNGGPGWAKAHGSGWLPHGWRERDAMFRAFTAQGAGLLPAPPPPPPAAAAPSRLPVLAVGSTGPSVGRLIDWANEGYVRGYGMAPILKLDPPYFGPGCEAFLKEFQRRVGFTGRDVDGVLGPDTWAHAWRYGLRP